MHTLAIPQSIIDRVVARRGKAHIYEDLAPVRTALVVVDLQNAFMLDGVGHAVCAEAREIVPNVNRLARTVRANGGTVVWIKTLFTEESLQDWSTSYAMLRPERARHRIEALSKGGRGYELWSGLEVKPEDMQVDKQRFSAFLPNSSDLAPRLRQRGIDTVLITGTVTNVCCESSARDAMMMNFRTVMVSDGNAAATDEEHNASLIAFYLTFGDVMSTDMLIDCLARQGRAAAAQ